MKTFPIVVPMDETTWFDKVIRLKQYELLIKSGFTHIDLYEIPGMYSRFTIKKAIRAIKSAIEVTEQKEQEEMESLIYK